MALSTPDSRLVLRRVADPEISDAVIGESRGKRKAAEPFREMSR